MEGAHTGKNIAGLIMEVIDELGIHQLVSYVVLCSAHMRD
jgi:hypothetical protein